LSNRIRGDLAKLSSFSLGACLLVRVWCVPVFVPLILDNKRFNGLHNEVPVIIAAAQKLNAGLKGGWVHHPEVKKWRYRLGELVTLHDVAIVSEFEARGYSHRSPLRNVDGIVPQNFMCSFKECQTDVLELCLRQVLDRFKPKGAPRASSATAMIRQIQKRKTVASFFGGMNVEA